MDYRDSVIRLFRRTIGFGILVVVQIVYFSPEGRAAESHRQQMIAATKKNCVSAKELLEQGQLQSFNRKRIAFEVLTKEWQEKMPAHLRENLPAQLQPGLDIEAAALKSLTATTQPLLSLIKDCYELTEASDQSKIAELEMSARQIDKSLMQLLDRWKEEPQAKANFKSSLEKTIDTMMQYNAKNVLTYGTVKLELDPDHFDLVIGAQRALVTSMLIPFNLLK